MSLKKISLLIAVIIFSQFLSKEAHTGNINSVPETTISYKFSFYKDNGQSDTFKVVETTVLEELGGVRDPSQPSGPANRNIVRTTEVKASVGGGNRFDPHKNMPPRFMKLVKELEELSGFNKGEEVIGIHHKDFSSLLIQYAKDKHSIVLEKM